MSFIKYFIKIYKNYENKLHKITTPIKKKNHDVLLSDRINATL